LTIPTFAYTPPTGYNNTTTYPNPADGTAARLQIQSIPDQIAVHLNALKAIFEAVTDGASGADHVAATAIAGVTGATVQAQLESLKGLVDAVVLGGIPAGSVTDAMLDATAGAILPNATLHYAKKAEHIGGLLYSYNNAGGAL
jgi:hypothetical protein